MNRALLWGGICTTGVVVVATVFALADPASADSGTEQRKLFTVGRGDLRITLTENGTLVAKESKQLKPEVKGEAKITWLIDEGSTVDEGAEICKFDTKELEQEIEQTELDIVQAETSLNQAKTALEIQQTDNLTAREQAAMDLDKAKKDLERYRDGDSMQERRRLEIAIKDAETTWSRVKKIYEDSQILLDQKFIRQTELEDHKLEFEKAEVTLEGARLELRLFEKYTYPMTLAEREAAVRKAERDLESTDKRNETNLQQKQIDVGQAEKRLKKLRERLDERKEDLGKMVLTAPVPGIVVYGTPNEPWSRGEVRVGRSVWRGFTVATIPDLRVMQVQVKIHEADINKLKSGMPAKVTMDTYPGVVLDGEVSKIAQIAGTRDRWGENTEVKLFDVEVTIADLQGLSLKPGISASAEIFVQKVEDTMFVPLQSVGLEGGEHYCHVLADGRPQRRTIQVGTSNDNFIEVREGIAEGDQVLLYNPALSGGESTGTGDGTGDGDDESGAAGAETAAPDPTAATTPTTEQGG